MCRPFVVCCSFYRLSRLVFLFPHRLLLHSHAWHATPYDRSFFFFLLLSLSGVVVVVVLSLSIAGVPTGRNLRTVGVPPSVPALPSNLALALPSTPHDVIARFLRSCTSSAPAAPRSSWSFFSVPLLALSPLHLVTGLGKAWEDPLAIGCLFYAPQLSVSCACFRSLAPAKLSLVSALAVLLFVLACASKCPSFFSTPLQLSSISLSS